MLLHTRAPTPSAAAELVSGELAQMMVAATTTCSTAKGVVCNTNIVRWQEKHQSFKSHVINSVTLFRKLQLKQQQVDELNHRLFRVIEQQIKRQPP